MSLEESVSTAPVESSSSEGLYSTEDIVARLRESEPEAPAEQVVEDVPAEEAPVPEQPEQAVSEHPEYPMPEGWEDAMWQGMAPEVRGKVDAVMKAHAKALGDKALEVQAMQAQHREVMEKANADALNLLNFMHAVTESDYQGIDWNALETADPAASIQLRKAYEARVAAIRQMKEQWAARHREAEEARTKASNEAMKSELAAVLPRVKALVGAGYSGESFRTELSGYLEKSGVPTEAIGMMSKGYELELATKAMLYDKHLEARKAATAKLAEAPKVQSPRGSSQEDGGDVRGQRLRALRNNPRSVDAIAELLKVW